MKNNIWNKRYADWTLKDGVGAVAVIYGTAFAVYAIVCAVYAYKEKWRQKKLNAEKIKRELEAND